MAKTYLDIVKYMVEAKFSIDGLVDKPDIIGAVFGQTEGLLGDELDLRELQKNGKIGRIEIELSSSGSKTYGKLFLPASLDRVETCILAAAVESVDRVGPYEASFQVGKVEDTRSEKRRKLLERAKELVKTLLTTEIPDSKELAELVQSDVKASEILTYGPEKLPAGPDIKKSNEVIIVEGRADVLNLLRNDITNVIAIGGATNIVPKSIIELCNEKEITVFLDGDRGGELILRSLLNVAEIDFVAKAPEGKEVEELTRKEVIKSLRTKVPIDQYLGTAKARQEYQQRQQNRPMRENGQMQQPRPPQVARTPPPPPPARPQMGGKPTAELMEIEEAAEELQVIEPSSQIQESRIIDSSNTRVTGKPALESMILSQLAASLDELAGTLRSRLYSPDGSIVKELPIRELIIYMQDPNLSNVYGVVLDGVITQRLVELALQKSIRAIYGLKANPMPKRHPELIIYTKEQGKIE